MKKPSIRILLNNITALMIVCFTGAGCAGTGRESGMQVNRVINTINGEPVVPREANRILIHDFTFHGDHAVLVNKLTLRVRDLIARDGRLGVVTSGEIHDLLLTGGLMLYQVRPLKYDSMGIPVKKRMRMAVFVRLINVKNDREIFRDPDVQAFEEFSDNVPPITSEMAIQDAVVENLAKRISRKVISGWYTELLSPVEKGRR